MIITPPRHIRILPLACLILASAAAGRAAAPADLERDALQLRNGSLLESIYFKNVWLKEHPTEDAVVLPQETVRGERLLATAICAYTNRGAVFIHSSDYGTVPLPALRSGALNQASRVTNEFKRAHAPIVPGPASVAGDDDSQIARAYRQLHDHDIMGDFPVAISPLEGTDWLIFDWNEGHYAYRPDAGVIRLPVPVDPLTGHPYLCAALGDLVESVIFCAEYRRARPTETAAVLFFPNDPRHGENTGGMAAAAYTDRGSLCIHSVYFGNMSLSEDGRGSPAGDFNDLPRISRAYRRYLWNRFAAAYRTKYGAAVEPSQLHRGGPEIVDALGTKIPQSLPGDTPELQIRRAYQRAQALGLSSEVGTEARPDDPRVKETCLVLCWNVSEYVYTPSRGGHYGVETDATSLPNRLVDGVLFASRYRRDHPGQTAIAIPYREAGGGKWKAVTAYTRDGQVWLHNPETGESPFPSHPPADLDNPAKFKDIRLDGNKLIKEEAVRRIKAKSATLNRLTINRLANQDALEPSAVCDQLSAAGIPCRLHATTRERDNAGVVREYALPSVTFQWWGVSYTYGPGHYCSASDEIVVLP